MPAGHKSSDGFGQSLWDQQRFFWRNFHDRRMTITWRKPTQMERTLYDGHAIISRFGDETHAIADIDGRVGVIRERDFHGWPDPPRWVVFVLEADGRIWTAADYNQLPRRWNLNNVSTITLWRPTGAKECALVEQSGWTAWPARLPDQPIFYPVTNRDYADQIARDWNTMFDDKIGYVTQFEVRTSYLASFEKQIVGGGKHEEYWIPAEQLEEFNANIVGLIEVVATYTEQDRLAFEARAKT